MSRQQQQQQRRQRQRERDERMPDSPQRVPSPSPSPELASFLVSSPATLPCSICRTAPPPSSSSSFTGAACLNTLIPSAASPTCPAACAAAAAADSPAPPRKRSSTLSTSVVVVAPSPSGSSSVPNSGLHADAFNHHKRSHRHSIPSHRLSNYLKFLNELAAKGSSTAQLFSTAVISGSSSAPNLKEMPQPVDPESQKVTPGVRPLETLHNSLSLRQLDSFLGYVTSANFKAPNQSPPLRLSSGGSSS